MKASANRTILMMMFWMVATTIHAATWTAKKRQTGEDEHHHHVRRVKYSSVVVSHEETSRQLGMSYKKEHKPRDYWVGVPPMGGKMNMMMSSHHYKAMNNMGNNKASMMTMKTMMMKKSNNIFRPMRRPYRMRRPPHGPPYKAPTMAPVYIPTVPVTTNFAAATTDNPIIDLALAPPGSVFLVDIVLPDTSTRGALYFVDHGNAVNVGSPCPPMGGIRIPTRGPMARLEITGDKVVALCNHNGGDATIVAVSYHVFEDFDNVGGSDPDLVSTHV